MEIESPIAPISIEGQSFLKSIQIYEYDETTVIRDLFQWINVHTAETINLSDEYLESFVIGYIDEWKCRLNLDYPLDEYVKNNAQDNELLFHYEIGTGGAWTEKINDALTIAIYYDESEHIGKSEAHVHIQKGSYHTDKKYREGSKKDSHYRSYENTVRMTIIDPHIIDEEIEGKNNHKNEINKKDIKIAKNYIVEHKDELLMQYGLISKGAAPKIIGLENGGLIG